MDWANLEFDSDVGRSSFLNYFKTLLRTLWKEEEGFSGKRPFGNSGWKFSVYKGLIEHNLIPGEIDEDGFVAQVDEEAADKLICELIDKLG